MILTEILSIWNHAQNHSIIKNFVYIRGVTPLSDPFIVLGIVAGYLGIIFGLQAILTKSKNAVPLGFIPAIHNLILCVGSLVMFVGAFHASTLESEENTWIWGEKNKYTWLLCFPVGTRSAGRVFFWSYVYYLSKFYELLDTLILVLKKKQLSFLHVYHHCLVVAMCYLWLEGQQSLQTIGLLANTGIHVVMYFYYFLHSIGCPPPWKKFVTNSQIIQFMFSFVVSIPFLWLHFKGPGCAGFPAWLFNVGFNLTLLLLFADFHRRQYGKAKAKRSRKVD